MKNSSENFKTFVQEQGEWWTHLTLKWSPSDNLESHFRGSYGDDTDIFYNDIKLYILAIMKQ